MRLMAGDSYITTPVLALAGNDVLLPDGSTLRAVLDSRVESRERGWQKDVRELKVPAGQRGTLAQGQAVSLDGDLYYVATEAKSTTVPGWLVFELQPQSER